MKTKRKVVSSGPVMLRRLDEWKISKKTCFSIERMYGMNTRSMDYLAVRLNLINHFVGFIPCQFSCNSAFRNLVFRWESCKGSVWECVKKCSRLCTEAGTCDWISRVARDWQAARGCKRVKHTEKLNHHASCSTTRQKVQTGHSVSSQLELATQSSRQLALFWKTDSSHSILTPI